MRIKLRQRAPRMGKIKQDIMVATTQQDRPTVTIYPM